jgi:hypothetical protein
LIPVIAVQPELEATPKLRQTAAISFQRLRIDRFDPVSFSRRLSDIDESPLMRFVLLYC